MSTFAVKVEPLAVDAAVTNDVPRVVLADGRELTVPLAWFPRLRDATPEEWSRWELIGAGIGIHWPQIDEDISVESLLAIH